MTKRELDECPTCGTAARYHPQCGYAMVKLLERLVAEGYVRDDRQKELLERTANMNGDRGFLSDAEVKKAQHSQDLEDFLL